tara:strand:- start:4940 stop:6079 length:1140 start_codon:yes stop_codon:yes gene_type:complete
VSIIDYEDGIMSNYLQSNKSVELIEFQNGIKTKKIFDTILVMQSILPNTIRSELNIEGKTKIFFWNLYHYNLVPDFLPIDKFRKINKEYLFFKKVDYYVRFIFYKKLKKLIQDLHSHNSICFMDYSNYIITKKFLFLDIYDPKILPICTDDTFIEKIKQNSKEHYQLRFCWVGRVEDFKTSILKYSLEKISKFSKKNKRKTTFTIIGYGKDIDKIKNEIKQHDFFSLNFKGSLYGKKLKDYLKNNVDIMMAMGTSALESGLLGIPTILLDASFFPIARCYRFRWLFQSDGSNLANFVDQINDYKGRYHIDEIICDFDKNNFEISKKCQRYVLKNHSVKTIAKKLINCLNEAQFSFNDIDKYLLRKNLIRKLYESFKYNS